MIKNILSFLAVLMLITSCGKRENRIESTMVDDRAERVEALQQYVKFSSPVRDAEFNLFNVNGFGGRSMDIPGGSSWNYTFVVRVDTADIHKWHEHMTEVPSEALNIQWTNDLVNHRKGEWQTAGEARGYALISPGSKIYVIIYPVEGIVFKREIQD